MTDHNDNGINQQPRGDGSRDSEEARMNGSGEMQTLIGIARNLEKGQASVEKRTNKALRKGKTELRTDVTLLNDKCDCSMVSKLKDSIVRLKDSMERLKGKTQKFMGKTQT